jgi:transposase
MLAETADFVVGVDTHGQRHSFALVHARTGALVREWKLPACAQGYREALTLAQQLGHGRRLWALEGSGCYGAGLARFLLAAGECVGEVERPLRRGVQGRLKSDSLDALRAARAGFERPLARPRADGTREALRVLLATREQAVQVRRVGFNQLRALLVTAPDQLRQRLAGLPRTRLAIRCRTLRLPAAAGEQERATVLALRLCAQRVTAADQEAQTLEREIERLVRTLAPALLDEPGVGPISAGFLLLGWSHQGRLRSEAAFARLAGSAPIPASSGKTVRHRLDRGGDRRLNRALHTIVLTRRRSHPATIAYIERRTQEGKTTREAVRCLKRYLARHLYRLLEATPSTA